MDYAPSSVTADREMLLLKRSLGGKVVEVRINDDPMPVLKLPNGVMVTMESVSPSAKLMLSRQGHDLHVLKNQADISEFARRYKNFRGASGQA